MTTILIHNLRRGNTVDDLSNIFNMVLGHRPILDIQIYDNIYVF